MEDDVEVFFKLWQKHCGKHTQGQPKLRVVHEKDAGLKDRDLEIQLQAKMTHGPQENLIHCSLLVYSITTIQIPGDTALQ